MMNLLHKLSLEAALFVLVLAVNPALAQQGSAAGQTAPATREVDGPTGLGISANPAAVETSTGSGEVQRLVLKRLGVTDDLGVRFGGLWLADCNWLISGGQNPGALSCNSALVLDNHIDLKKLTGWWTGGSFGAEFLQLNASRTNYQAGSVQG